MLWKILVHHSLKLSVIFNAEPESVLCVCNNVEGALFSLCAHTVLLYLSKGPRKALEKVVQLATSLICLVMVPGLVLVGLTSNPRCFTPYTL